MFLEIFHHLPGLKVGGDVSGIVGVAVIGIYLDAGYYDTPKSLLERAVPIRD